MNFTNSLVWSNNESARIEKSYYLFLKKKKHKNTNPKLGELLLVILLG